MCFCCNLSLLLYHCSPQRGEMPITPGKLHNTAKYKCNIGKTLQHIGLAFEVQDNRGAKRDCKEVEKIKWSCKPNRKGLLLFSILAKSVLIWKSMNYKGTSNLQMVVHISLYCRQCSHSYRLQVTSPHSTISAIWYIIIHSFYILCIYIFMYCTCAQQLSTPYTQIER